MAKVTFTHSDGKVDVLDVEDGTSVMRAAVLHGIRGIVGECGGQAMCATCHVYVHHAHLAALPAVTAEEDEMLDCTAEPRDDARSRLGCQLEAGIDFEELEVEVPARQH
jgi:ferredoxin, 2Fe-2S